MATRSRRTPPTSPSSWPRAGRRVRGDHAEELPHGHDRDPVALRELAERAGVPKGVFSCVTGRSNEIVGELTSNPIVRKLTFTGSTEDGRLLMQQCAGTVKKLSLELGGNAPVYRLRRRRYRPVGDCVSHTKGGAGNQLMFWKGGRRWGDSEKGWSCPLLGLQSGAEHMGAGGQPRMRA
jgi:hypothetical protein